MIKKLLVVFFLFSAVTSSAQLLSWSPEFITESSSNIKIYVDGSKGNQGLFAYNPFDVYVHIGVITNLSSGGGDWKHVVSAWGSTDPAFKAAVESGQSKWSFTIPSNLRSYFNVTDPNEKIEKIAILFRNSDGSRKQANADGSDMYIPVYTAATAVRITQPPFQPTFQPVPETITKTVGDNMPVTAIANKPATMTLYLNGIQIQTANSVTSLSANPVLVTPGNQQIVARADDGSTVSSDTLRFFVSGSVTEAPLPAGMQQGINYINATTVTLVLYAPGKGRVSVIGDFPGNDWTEESTFQMNRTPDQKYWWITLTGLTPGKEYSFQYLVNGNLRIADPYAEKILDPYNDQYISTTTYPNLKPYPAGKTTEVVSILQTNQPAYNWGTTTYTRPDQRNLIIYELLVRDFVAKHDWNGLRDTLSYLKRLGVNAVEIMPFNEFEGNSSWGYNPDFYFAPDKYYGPAATLREFIDSCHANGIAVVMDIALNHSFGMSPMVRLYWDAANNRPALDNPWFNPVAKHAYNVGYDMNHESAATKYFVNRVVKYWLEEYKIDGFRFDLSKGFTQKQTCDNNGNNCNVAAWSAYDQSRIDIWKNYYDSLQKFSPGSYVILEHFADSLEEVVLSNYGMMLWGNLNYNYNEATMGYGPNWNFEKGIAGKRGFSGLNLITYMESHDEERLMYKNLQYGNSTASYNIKVLDTALQRQALAAAFFFTIPGPKMLWQFGELGYDYSINHCPDNSINPDCRTDPKPIRWDYYQDARRRKLFEVYRNLIHLRMNPAFVPAFTSTAITQDLSGPFKWLMLNSSAGKLVAIGNFDVTTRTGSVTFPVAGTWYDYLNGTTISATGAAQSFELKPGEFHVFTNTFVALSVNLKSFTGVNQGTQNLLTWETDAEQNLLEYQVQRSRDGLAFTSIGRVAAAQKDRYQFVDTDLSGAPVWYYRLQITNKDGSSGFSNIIAIRGVFENISVSVMPNPFSRVLKCRIESPLMQKADVIVTAMDGKPLLNKSFQLQAGINDIGFAEAAALPDGIYFLKVIVAGQAKTVKVIKQH